MQSQQVTMMGPGVAEAALPGWALVVLRRVSSPGAAPSAAALPPAAQLHLVVPSTRPAAAHRRPQHHTGTACAEASRVNAAAGVSKSSGRCVDVAGVGWKEGSGRQRLGMHGQARRRECHKSQPQQVMMTHRDVSTTRRHCEMGPGGGNVTGQGSGLGLKPTYTAAPPLPATMRPT